MGLQFLSAAALFLTISKFCNGADRLSANQTLSDGDVLTSPSQIFELGFFSPGSSTTRYLGIRYKATPNVVFWIANREDPILSKEVNLTLARNGSLILSSGQGTIIWSYKPSMPASSPVLKLLDTGNLVLMEDTKYIWQSFDYPCDTRLPGMKMVDDPDVGSGRNLTSWKSPDDPSDGEFVYRIENHGLSQLSIFRGGVKQYRSGHWNGVRFIGLPLTPDPNTKFETELSSVGKLISLSEPYNSSSLARVALSSSGLLQGYIMNEERDGWVARFSEPSNSCYEYGACGPNGICRVHKQKPVCECLKGFKPKSQEQWDLLVWTSGCTRVMPLDCKKEHGFHQVKRVKFPDTLNYQLNASMSIDECSDECLKNCNCVAYADPYAGSNSSSCLMWYEDLIDVQDFTGEVGPEPSIYIRLPISELGNKRKRPVKTVLIAAAASFGMLLLGFCCGVTIFRIRQRQAYKKKMKEFKLPLYGFSTIAAATKNFSEENMIGRGGFGPVYKGYLSVEEVIAVKRMSRTSRQGPKEFKNEVTLIAELQHRNLVRISGCCIEREENMIIYEYMHNRSLDYFIFDQNRSTLLNWPMRLDIIMGIARGLLYLHHDSRLKIIHRDLKTSNILLDENMNAKISDFGLARMFEGNQTTASTKRVVGTYGYMAPEYAFEGKFSVKSDVFSLGVVILEIVSGTKNRGFNNPSFYQNPLEQAWLLWKEHRELELMDPCYNSSYVESQVKRCIQVGLLCIQNVADDRPVMPSVVLMLSSEDSVLPEPKKPGFFLHSSSSPSQIHASGNSITMSEVEGR